jgi:hypothetical protein
MTTRRRKASIMDRIDEVRDGVPIRVRTRDEAWRVIADDPRGDVKTTYDRVVRDVVVHDVPRRLGDYHYEYAVGTVKLPWGVEQVRAWSCFDDLKHVQWELIDGFLSGRR